MAYVKGSLVRVRFCFTSRDLTQPEVSAFRADGTLPAGVGLDPATVKFNHRAPGSVTTTTLAYPTDAPLVRGAAGSYYVDIDTSTAVSVGTWDYRGYSTGIGQAATEGNFEITTLF